MTVGSGRLPGRLIAGTPTLPEHCLECGLHACAKTWNVHPEHDGRPIPGLWDRRPILVVGQGPGFMEDQMGRPFTGEAGAFLREYTERLEVPVIYDGVTRCFPGRNADGYDNAPGDPQVKICSSVYLAETIRKYRPAAIVCLGVAAMNGVLGEQSPGSIAKAGKGVLRFPGLPDTVVMVSYHPVTHVNKTRDLREDYLRIFQYAEQVAIEGIPDDGFTWDLVQDPEVALARIDRLSYDVVFYDAEWRQTSAALDRLTYWHQGFELLCASFTFVVGPCKYETLCVAGPALCREVVEKALRGKHVGAHNLPSDAQATWIGLGVDLYSIAAGLIDTLQEFYLPDQSKFDHGLKSVCQRILRTPPWDQEVWNQVDAENKRRQEYNSKLRSLNTQRKKQDLPPLEKQPLDADFSVVRLRDLAEYNSHDTHKDARIFYEYLEKRPEEERPHPLAMRLTLRAMHPLARTERRGMPFREERLEALKVAHADKIQTLTELMLRQPEVGKAIQALREQKQYPAKVQDGQLFNVKSPDFFPHLVHATEAKVEEKTKTGKMASDKDILARLGKISKKNQNIQRNRNEWVWYYFHCIRQSRDMISKFIDQFQRFIINGRAHTTFKLAKVEVPGRASGADDVGGGATTGRLASAQPQCHNMKKDRPFRSCVGYDDDADLAIVETDYDRIEPVCLTVLCECVGWKEALAKGIDLYKWIATKIPSLGYTDVSQVSKTDRDLIKVHTLAVMYDESPQSFARDLGIPVEEARAFYDAFYAAFPEILEWKRKIKFQVVRGEMITTLFGRRKSFELRYPEKDWSHLVDLENLDLDRLSKVEHDNLKILRQAVNFPVQSLASDITLWKLQDVFDWIDQQGLEEVCHPINTVHDAVWFDMLRERISEFIPNVIRIMEDRSSLPIDFPIPLGVTLKVGTNLGYMIEVKKHEIAAFVQDPECFIAWAQEGHGEVPEGALVAA